MAHDPNHLKKLVDSYGPLFGPAIHATILDQAMLEVTLERTKWYERKRRKALKLAIADVIEQREYFLHYTY